ncbi:hypothetical protein Y032_1207g3755 [Ancylostoma ceylanicum]|uniref:Integrase catalytic domain-containing protein n=1 Tax=Ancylostoma ceylanicum TaxID=53326 RepID=A0A016W5X3_9BILA|nr:hypothetical protein Y032_1207g3755 [Ancylostoma ceylanicum]
MLRRFFARRGIPQSITSDNAPTFELGETILNESISAARSDPSVSRALSNREIEWRHITPFAPWQGGFYERLIKSVKQSLFKTLGRSSLSFEGLTTILIEIEAILNTRPLTYITGEPCRDIVLRPIDFLQKVMVVFHPIGPGTDEIDDPQYLPPEDLVVLQTKRQAITALESSCRFTEKFWNIWQTQYLTALREKHTLQVTRKKGCAQPPSEGTLVLISDPVLPRHSWKMGAIDQLIVNARGTVREAVVRLPSQRLIR